MLCCTWRTAFPCPTRPWPKPKVGVMIPPKKQPTPAEGPKVATDAPPIFVVPGPQLPATSRVGWDGWGNFSPRQLSASSQACSFQGGQRVNYNVPAQIYQDFGGQTHLFQPRSSCLRASRSYKRRCHGVWVWWARSEASTNLCCETVDIIFASQAYFLRPMFLWLWTGDAESGLGSRWTQPKRHRASKEGGRAGLLGGRLCQIPVFLPVGFYCAAFFEPWHGFPLRFPPITPPVPVAAVFSHLPYCQRRANWCCLAAISFLGRLERQTERATGMP